MTLSFPKFSLTSGIGRWVALVAAVQSAALGWMVLDRVQLLRNGREIVLPVIPVDPRSLFRGDYVRLGYSVSQVDVAVPPDPGKRGHYTARIYTTLEKSADGAWTAKAASLVRPAALGKEQVLLAGRGEIYTPSAADKPAKVFVQYGIESYFVPEGTGLELEKAVRDKKIAAVLAIDGKGTAAIKGLMVDGKLVHKEPLF